jgi:uncharacterized protein YjbJ (UPF0337 family)
MAGEKDKVKGSVKETVGKGTGDERTEAEGTTGRAKGEVEDTAHDVEGEREGCGR